MMVLRQITLTAMLALGFASANAAEVKYLNNDTAMKVCTGVVNDKCIVRHFKDTVEASVIRGKISFQNYCVLCHGVEGKGDGRAAKLHTPPPFNLTMSVIPTEYVEQIIRKGGEPMGRSKGMPPWGEQLTNEQINDTINFLQSIRIYK